MNADFWHRRWEKGEIGFHKESFNAVLERHGAEFLPASGATTVFVPLCGKTVDMIWLREHGHRVVGVELSAVAAAAFFEENDLSVTSEADGAFQLFRGDRIEIRQGDFFRLRREHLAGVEAVYDRAALIALPEPIRVRYVKHLEHLLRSGTRVLLITIEYPAEELNGPPFSVSDEEVRRLFEPGFSVEQLGVQDALQDEPRFRQRGVTRMTETSWLLVRR
ncbi:MAG TPA: thiopurine S-methyltransferase [Candidatus Kapabacteria bacterium]|nr:thiopurine S-methyltransferase [Candidatus Kapabacteria bacterium]